MKKLFALVLICFFCVSAAIPVYAQDEDIQETQMQTVSEEETQNASQPRLMVSSYDSSVLTPSEDHTVKITFKNFSKDKSVYNIKLSAIDESGDIRADGVGTKYVDKIKAGGTYEWSLPVTVAKTAVSGEHKLSVTAEYEDEYYTPFTTSDTIAVTVAQSVGLAYDGVILPQKVTQGETASITVNFMNTGKSVVRNCSIKFDVEGLQTGGVLFAGEIPAGSNTEVSANFSVSKDMLGEVSGTATISYEDELGGQYSETVDLSTVIEEPPDETKKEEEEKSKYPLWWLFLIVGIAAGGAVGFAVPTVLHSRKQRLEDEKRL